LQQPVSITAIASISPLGKTLEETWQSYLNDEHCFSESTYLDESVWVAQLSKTSKAHIEALRQSDNKYKALDDTVLFAIYASRQAVAKAGWKATDNFGINIGSSRGATALFEKYHESFLEHHKSDTLSSPTTTLGNIASWVAHDLQTEGPEISHSITCSTALHSVLNGIAWLASGMCNTFLVGGSEAPLTHFTIAQMKALKIYSKSTDKFPCRTLDFNKAQNTMILGEGATMVCLEKGLQNNALCTITGIGYATEILKHNISISSDAKCFQKSMQMALGNRTPESVDVIVMHAPGTIKGDLSEFKAIEKSFPNKMPYLTSNKWKIGHTFGASGTLSLELGVLMLQHQKCIGIPYLETSNAPKTIKHILINAVGFGGNAVSILISK
jgi:3-oxoacyl-(acyl-carrier-protein) synthase